MSYITLSNAMGIINKSNNHTDIDFSKEIYKIPIYFFSKYEKNCLLAIQELLENPEKYFSEIYEPIIKSKDTFQFIYESQSPSFHENVECKRLLSDYENFQIPVDITEKGPEEVNLFRDWFKGVKHHLEENPDIFVARLQARWNILTNVQAINISNSGSVKMENRPIEEIERNIEKLIKSAGRFYYKSEKNTEILKKFSRMTFLAYKDDPIYGNNTKYKDHEIKLFLKHYNEQYKKPLKNDLIQYYRLKLNPKIELKGEMLSQLGFQLCGSCNQNMHYN